MKVFVTGGTGLVGSHVAERLVREGHSVRALLRPGTDASHLDGLGAEVWAGDITEPESLAGAFQDCEGLVHAAAAVTARASWDFYHRVNVAGTEVVLAAAAAQGVRRAVHVSTVAVYGGAEIAEHVRVDEDTPTDSPLAPEEFYGRSKRGAEAVAWQFQREGRLDVTLVRPDVIYGERDRAVIPRLARIMRFPVVPLVGDGRSELPLVYAGNVAQGIVLALTSLPAAGRAYNLANDFPITQREFFQLLARCLGRQPRFLPLPASLATGVAWSFERIVRLRGRRRPVVSRRHVAFMARGNPFVSARAAAELGWRPEVRHEEGVRRTMDWYASGQAPVPFTAPGDRRPPLPPT